MVNLPALGALPDDLVEQLGGTGGDEDVVVAERDATLADKLYDSCVQAALALVGRRLASRSSRRSHSRAGSCWREASRRARCGRDRARSRDRELGGARRRGPAPDRPDRAAGQSARSPSHWEERSPRPCPQSPSRRRRSSPGSASPSLELAVPDLRFRPSCSTAGARPPGRPVAAASRSKPVSCIAHAVLSRVCAASIMIHKSHTRRLYAKGWGPEPHWRGPPDSFRWGVRRLLKGSRWRRPC